MTTERPDPPTGDDDLPPLTDHLRNHPDRPDAPMKVRSQTRLLLLLMFAAIPLLAVFAVVLGSLAEGPPSTDPNVRGTSSGLAQVTRYCNYAAQSEAEFQPCLDEHRDRAFLDDDTNPARYARGDLDRCLDDAGPRCTARQTVRQ